MMPVNIADFFAWFYLVRGAKLNVASKTYYVDG
jgi:hypothetical protein